MEKGDLFFQPGTLWVQLHLEPAYLLVQFGIVIRFCSLLLSAVKTEFTIRLFLHVLHLAIHYPL